jgi:hypothetical protein
MRKIQGGTSVPVIPPEIAVHIYRVIHRARVAVIALDENPRVYLHPRIQAVLKLESLRRVQSYVRYKAFFVRIPRASHQPLGWVGAFSQWCDQVDCENEHDPRCLPFHVFSGNASGLDNPERRHLFNQEHGSAHARTDRRGLTWRLDPRAYHGQEALCVSGTLLPPGFHWDVETAGRTTEVSTPEGVWQVMEYVNVYPDAHLRPRPPHARKLA